MQALLSGQRPNWGMVAAQSFGQSLGQSLADRSQARPAMASTSPSNNPSALSISQPSAASETRAIMENANGQTNGTGGLTVSIESTQQQIQALQQVAETHTGAIDDNVVVTASRLPDTSEWNQLGNIPDYLGNHSLRTVNRNSSPTQEQSPISVGYGYDDGKYSGNLKASLKDDVSISHEWSDHLKTGVSTTKEGSFAIGSKGVSGEGKLSTTVDWLKYNSQGGNDSNQVNLSLSTEGRGSLSVSNDGVKLDLNADLIKGGFKIAHDTGIFVGQYSDLSIPLSEISGSFNFGGGIKGTVANGVSEETTAGLSLGVKTVDFNTDWGLSGQVGLDAGASATVKVGKKISITDVEANWSTTSTLDLNKDKFFGYFKGILNAN
jgi:hypothetical protein